MSHLAPLAASPTASAAPRPAPRATLRTLLRGPWAGFLVRRTAALAGIAASLVLLSFAMVRLIPGDPAVAIAGADAGPEEIAATRERLGLDLPLAEQFIGHVRGLLHGDLGTSFMYGRPVAELIGNRLPFTLAIAVAGIVVTLAVAIPLGMGVAVLTRSGRRPRLDAAFGVVTGLLDAVPGYVLATGLVLLLALGVGLVPLLPPAYTGRAPVASLVLPVAAVVVGPICTLSRVVRRETGRVLGQDHMRTARSWRLGAATLFLGHALPNILTTALTLSGLILGGMLGGTLIIEQVFSVPGLGSGMIKAILDRDLPVIQGMVLVVGLMVAIVNLAVDVLLALVDPRTLGGRHDVA